MVIQSRRPGRERARVLVIRQGFFPLDPRVNREVTALVSSGCEVDVVCVRRDGERAFESAGSLTIRRLPVAYGKGGVVSYLWKYVLFLLWSLLLAARLHLRRRYDLVQVNTLPDVLVFAALVPRLLGSPVLLDLHETMPEFLATKFGRSPRHVAVRLVSWLEQLSIRFATFAITCTEQMKEAFVERGAEGARIGVVLNSANEEVFASDAHRPAARRPGRFTLIAHGTIEDRYGIDTAIEAVAALREDIPEIELRVIGDGTILPDLRRLAGELGVEDRVYFSGGFVPMPELLAEIAAADLGLVAMKRDAFRDLTHCNKMFDFISMRKPAVVSRTRSVQAYFDEDCFGYFEAGDPIDLARVILKLYRDPERARRIAARATAVNQPFRWPVQRDLYLRYVSDLVAGSVPAVTDRWRDEMLAVNSAG